MDLRRVKTMEEMRTLLDGAPRQPGARSAQGDRRRHAPRGVTAPAGNAEAALD